MAACSRVNRVSASMLAVPPLGELHGVDAAAVLHKREHHDVDDDQRDREVGAMVRWVAVSER